MGVFLFAQLRIHDPESYQTYVRMAGPLFKEHGVKLIVNDTSPKYLGRPAEADKVVLIEFKDEDHMYGFLALPAYQEASAFRDAGAETKAIKFDRFDGF